MNLEIKLRVLAELTARLAPRGITPILAGETALQLYAASAYAIADMDLVVSPRQAALEELGKMGFIPQGRHVVSEPLGIAVEIPDETLAGNKERLEQIQIKDGRTIYCIGVEDLIVDRLNAAVHWRSTEDRRWAVELIREYSSSLDMDYLNRRTEEEKTSALFGQILRECKPNNENL